MLQASLHKFVSSAGSLFALVAHDALLTGDLLNVRELQKTTTLNPGLKLLHCDTPTYRNLLKISLAICYSTEVTAIT